MSETEQQTTPQTGDANDLHEHGHWGAHDHSMGMYGHIHDESDPFHTHPGEEEMIILTPEEAGNRITLTSVGIDVGSSTSHLMFSRLTLERQGIALSSRFKVVDRSIVFRSPILLTPYTDETTIDTDELSRFIEGVYKDAGMTVEDVDTGATIFTGEAAKKSNAEAISALFAEHAGKFVCATAGPNLEGVMAAFGSGAAARSKRDGKAGTVMNIDMGGGTAKVAICQNGEVIETAAINVGARLVAMDKDGTVTRIEPAAEIIAEELGIPLKLGGKLSEAHQKAMAELLAECLYNLVERRPLGRLADRLMITGPLEYRGPIDSVSFSGGVSEYVYGTEQRNFGDLGILLGKAVMDRAPRLGVPIDQAEQMIRATVIGAGQYTLQVSGSTIYISRPDLLPHRNLQVVAPVMPGPDYTLESAKQAITSALLRQDIEEGDRPVALSFRWRMEPSYDRVKTLASAIAEAMPNTIKAGIPLTLVFDTDIGGAVGSMLTREVIPNHDIVSIDEVDLSDLDFIDLGEELEDVHAVPVVVKSLVFTTARERSAGLVRGVAPHLHDHDQDHDHGHDHHHEHHDHVHGHDHDHAHDHDHSH